MLSSVLLHHGGVLLKLVSIWHNLKSRIQSRGKSGILREWEQIGEDREETLLPARG